MTLTILDGSISSDRTPHTARLGPDDWRAWEVSWLPGRHLDRNGAITAMVLADLTASGDMDAGHWPHIEAWAAELALTAPEALARAAKPPTRGEAGYSVAPEDPEGAG
jgi:hypothetical protein